MNRLQFIADHRNVFEVKRLCEIVQVACSSFYAWLAAAPARTVRTDADTALAESLNAMLKRETLRAGPAGPTRRPVGGRCSGG